MLLQCRVVFRAIFFFSTSPIIVNGQLGKPISKSTTKTNFDKPSTHPSIVNKSAENKSVSTRTVQTKYSKSNTHNGKQIVEEKVDDNKVFDKVDIEASFPGGDSNWRQYLERNANGQVATDNGALEGTYTVVVQFVVDKEGNISDVRSLTNHGYGMEEEAMRVIKKGPKWNPAIQNGRQVKAYRKQPITFRVESDNGKQIVEEKVDDNKIFDKVDIEASFPGGDSKWRQYLERNVNGQVPTDNGAPTGTYTVVVQFVVDKEGNISDVRSLTNLGYGMEEEAIRVIKQGPKWDPAIQNMDTR